ncbi:MAG: flagellar motor switch protein FliN [Deltaproteobacteria bacterium]|nr:flagellar motor switch protein FliN [Deltaproteobacteria bacterium]
MEENQGNTEQNGSGPLADQWGEAFAEQKTQAEPKAARPEAKPASFNALKQETSAPVANLEMILDIPVTVSVEIGRTKMVVKDLLQLGQGTVVELEKLAGEPMEILVNGRLIARGEAVVVNEKFGIKLTDIVSPSERLSKLK